MGSCGTKRITYDANDGDSVVAGDALRTATGRTYLVVSARAVRSRVSRNRYDVEAVVVESVPPDARIHMLRWHDRSRKS